MEMFVNNKLLFSFLFTVITQVSQYYKLLRISAWNVKLPSYT